MIARVPRRDLPVLRAGMVRPGRLPSLAAVAVVFAWLVVGCAPAPSPTEVPGTGHASPPTTASPDASAGPTDVPAIEDWALACSEDGPAFPPAAIEGDGSAERAPDPAAAALRAFLATSQTPEMPFPLTGWHRAFDDGRRVLFVAPGPDDQPWLMVAFAVADGAWREDAFGACELRPSTRPGISIADWWLNPRAPAPAAGDLQLHVLVRERACSGGRPPAGRVLEPLVQYRSDSVVIVFAITEIPGGSDCPGNPSFPFVVELSEPLGPRVLLDGGQVPPAPPHDPG